MKISKVYFYITMLCICVVMPAMCKPKKGKEDRGAIAGLGGFFSGVFAFIMNTIMPLISGSQIWDGLCNTVLDFIPFTAPCTCGLNPSPFTLSAQADVTCPIFDTCPLNIGFICGSCDVKVSAGGSIMGPELEATLGATCTADSPLISQVAIVASGGVGKSLSDGFGLESCEVSATVFGFSPASCSCAVDDSCGVFGVQFNCQVLGVDIIQTGGCVNLNSLGI